MSSPSKKPGVPVKGWNFFVGAVGIPGTGKSHAIARRVAEESTRIAAYNLVHDPTGSYDEADYQKIWQAHGGTFRYPNARAALRGIASNPGGAHIIDAIDGGEVLEAGIKLAATSLGRAKDGHYHPVVVTLDEASGADGADSRKLSQEWLEAIVQRRHLGIGVAWTAQSTYVAHRMFLMQSTELYVFRQCDPADLRRLRAVGMSLEETAEVAELEDRRALVVVKNRVVGHLEPTAKHVTPAESQEKKSPKSSAKTKP